MKPTLEQRLRRIEEKVSQKRVGIRESNRFDLNDILEILGRYKAGRKVMRNMNNYQYELAEIYAADSKSKSDFEEVVKDMFNLKEEDLEERIFSKKKMTEDFDSEYNWKYTDSEYGVSVSQRSEDDILRYRGVIRFDGVRSLGVTKKQFEEALLKFFDDIGADY